MKEDKVTGSPLSKGSYLNVIKSKREEYYMVVIESYIYVI